MTQELSRRWIVWLVAVVAVVTALRLGVVAASGLGFHADEAQYWIWGRDLDWGYYTKPPLIAWLIRASSALCGEAEWCARAVSPVLYACTSLVCGLTARRLHGPAAGLWCGLLFLSLPAVSFSSALITTDVPLLLFWSIALYALLRILDDRSLAWSVLLGLALGAGFLGKYAMVYFVFGTVLACMLYQQHRWFLISRNLLVAVAVTGAVLAPNIVWNVANGWATVAHVWDNANLGRDLLHPAKMAEFLAAQFGMFGPFLFAVLIWRIFLLFRRRPAEVEGFLMCFVLPIMVIVTLQALLSRAHANWGATAFVAATILVAGGIVESGRMWLAKASLAYNAAVGVVLAVLFLDFAVASLPLEKDPRRNLRGWSETAAAVATRMRTHPDRILMTDDRKITAWLTYYLREYPWQPVIWDRDGRPDNHFELTASYRARPGDRVLLVARYPDPTAILRHFATARALDDIRVPTGDGRNRILHVYALDGHVTN